MIRKNLVGVAILLIGVFAGVLLIQQSQEYRERASVPVVRKVIICHKVEDDSDSWVEIEIDEDDLRAHLDHGDIIGKCPEEVE
jgi:hypothetical protein